MRMFLIFQIVYSMKLLSRIMKIQYHSTRPGPHSSTHKLTPTHDIGSYFVAIALSLIYFLLGSMEILVHIHEFMAFSGSCS